MFPPELGERLDTLIDALIMDGGIESASLASMLLAAKDSVKRDDHVKLSRRVWAANNELLAEYAGSTSAGSGSFTSDSASHSFPAHHGRFLK